MSPHDGVTPPDAPPRQPKFKALHVAGCPRTMLGKTCSCPNGTGYDTVEQATVALGKPQRLAGDDRAKPFDGPDAPPRDPRGN